MFHSYFHSHSLASWHTLSPSTSPQRGPGQRPGNVWKWCILKAKIIEFDAIFWCLETYVLTSLCVYKPVMMSVLSGPMYCCDITLCTVCLLCNWAPFNSLVSQQKLGGEQQIWPVSTRWLASSIAACTPFACPLNITGIVCVFFHFKVYRRRIVCWYVDYVLRSCRIHILSL